MKFISLFSLALLSLLFYSTLSKTTEMNYAFKDIYFDGNYIYGVLFSNKSLCIVDITDPDIPIVISNLSTFFRPFRIIENNGYAYVLETTGNEQTTPLLDNFYSYGYFNIFNVTNPELPQFLYASRYISRPHALAIINNLLFVSADNLYIYDVSNKTMPLFIITIPIVRPLEIAVQATTNSNIILFSADGSTLISYLINPAQNYSYQQSSYISNGARDLYISTDNEVIILSTNSLYSYSFANNGDLNEEISCNNVFTNIANKLYLEDSKTQFISFQPPSTTIVEYNILFNEFICVYKTNYQMDVIIYSNNYIFATQMNKSNFLILDLDTLICATESDYSLPMSVILGIAFGVLFTVLFIIGGVSRYLQRKKKNPLIYEPLQQTSDYKPPDMPNNDDDDD